MNSQNEKAWQYNEAKANQLSVLCEPLFKNTPIKNFRCGEFFNKGEYIFLSTDRIITRAILYNYDANGSPFRQAISKVEPGRLSHFLWPGDPTVDNMISGFYELNIWNGLTIYKREEDRVRFWCFAGDRTSFSLSNFYLNQKDLLEKFIIYLDQKKPEFFQDQPTLRPRALFPGNSPIDYVEDLLTQHALEILREKFNVQQGGGDLSYYLTNRQKECLFWLAQGKSAKEIARELNVSPRVIENHIDALRHKTGLRRKVELVNLFHKHKDFLNASRAENILSKEELLKDENL